MARRTKDYTPMQDILLELSEMVNKSGMSLREIARRMEKDGFNLYNVCAVANGKPQHLSSIVKFDSYLSGILKVLGYDDYDLIERTLRRFSDPNTSPYEDNLSVKIKEFLRNPESEKYIEFAYKKYKLDKLAEEQERIKRELDNM